MKQKIFKFNTNDIMESNNEILEEIERQINNYNGDIKKFRESIDSNETANYLYLTIGNIKEYERLVQVLENIRDFIIN